jgi:hypothetical protein
MISFGIFYSLIRTAGGTNYDIMFYRKDKWNRPGEFVKRRFRGIRHFLYRLIDTLRYAYPIITVYLFRSISAGFREKIIINTSLLNSCVL